VQWGRGSERKRKEGYQGRKEGRNDRKTDRPNEGIISSKEEGTEGRKERRKEVYKGRKEGYQGLN
jgi:hypothetical protein